jgi:hypothetical protein
MRAGTLRLGVLSYLTLVLFLWSARILALIGIIALPLGFGGVGAQADSITAALLIALGPGLVGLIELRRRWRLEQRN